MIFSVSLRAFFCAGLLAVSAVAATAQTLSAPAQPERRLTLTSPAWPAGGVLPDKYSLKDPAPVSPPLEWVNAPPGTVSLALIMYDPDGAQGGKGSADIVHWIVFNIPPTVTKLEENQPKQAVLPNGATQATIRPGLNGYSGAGARFVDHYYTFQLFALDTKLELGPDATRTQLLAAMDGHVLAKAAWVGRFHR